MLRRLLIVVVALSACADDDKNRHLADAPPLPDVAIDAPEDAPITPTQDLELAITKAGTGTGRITSTPAGIDCGATCTGMFEDGTLVTLTAEPDASSTFEGWGGACAGTSPVCEVTLSAAAAVTASFKLKTYTVMVTKAGAGAGTVAGNGLNCGSTCEITVDHGTAISLVATPVSLNTFVGWGGACTGMGTCDLTITQDTTISAAFALDEISLIVTRGGNGAGTIVSTPMGINCPGTCDFVFTANQMVSLAATPAQSSTFTGWTGACTGMGACVVTMDAAKTVTGSFTLKKYALDVTKNGSTGTGTVTSAPAGIACGTDCTEQVDHGTTIMLTAAPTLPGNTFVGWTGACTGTGACNVTVTGPTAVNARFDVLSYQLMTSVTGSGTISSSPGGIACPGDCAENFNHGTTVMLTPTPAMGWEFTTWGGACSGNGACSVTMDAAKMVTATFTIKQFTLDVSTVGLGSVTGAQIDCPGDCAGTYDYNTVVALTATHGTGYTFDSWSGACTGSGACNVTMDAAKMVTATFKINSYPLDTTFGGTGSGTISATGIACPGDCSEVFTHGTVVTVTQTPNGDSDFTGWSGGTCAGMGACMFMMDGPRTVTANYALKTYDLDVTITGSGTVSEGVNIQCPGDCKGTYTHGTMVTLTQAATPGYQFTGWSGACSGLGACTVNMTAAKAVGATFTQLFALNVIVAGSTGTVTSVPAGINCGADCTENYLASTPVMLTATGTGGATFASWSGAPGCATAATCTVTMSQARTVTATFNPPVFPLTVAIDGTGYGNVTASTIIDCGNQTGGGSDCSESLVQNTMVALTATPQTGVASEASFFTRWTGCTSVAGTTCNVTLDAAKTVTATFDIAPNVMFVTSTTREMFGANWVQTADALCKSLASQSARNIAGTGPHQNERWVPWLSGFDPFSTPNPGAVVTPASRLVGIGGWERVDRQPVMAKLSDIATNDIVYPPRIDENGTDVGPGALVWTGTDPAGNHSESSCIGSFQGVVASWTNVQVASTQGLASANSLEFTRLGNASCSGTRRLYCLGADRKASISVTRKRGRLAFTTATAFVAGGGTDAADSLCKSEASAAGLANAANFRALLATTTASAISRFAVSPTDEPWVRVGDNQPLTRSDTDMRNPNLSLLIVAPNVTASGQRLGNVEIWSGSPHPAVVGPNASATCSNWLDAQGTKSTGGYAFDTGVSSLWFGANSNTLDCATGRRLVCLEN